MEAQVADPHSAYVCARASTALSCSEPAGQLSSPPRRFEPDFRSLGKLAKPLRVPPLVHTEVHVVLVATSGSGWGPKKV